MTPVHTMSTWFQISTVVGFSRVAPGPPTFNSVQRSTPLRKDSSLFSPTFSQNSQCQAQAFRVGCVATKHRAIAATVPIAITCTTVPRPMLQRMLLQRMPPPGKRRPRTTKPRTRPPFASAGKMEDVRRGRAAHGHMEPSSFAASTRKQPNSRRLSARMMTMSVRSKKSATSSTAPNG